MKKTLLCILIFLCLTVYVICDQQSELKDGDVLATFKMNDKTNSITFTDYKYAMKSIRRPLPETENEKKEYAEDLVRVALAREVLSSSSFEDKSEEEASLRKSIENRTQEILIGALYKYISDKAEEPTQEDIEKYYQANKVKYRSKEEYQIQYVYSYCDDPENKIKWNKAREYAEEALEKIKNGEDFTEIAKIYSNSPVSQDGQVVSFNPNTINPTIEQVAKGLKKGEVSEIFPTKRGFMIVKLIEHIKQGYQPLDDELKKQIYTRLYAQAKRQYWDNYWNEYVKKMNVVKKYDLLDKEPVEDSAVIFSFNDMNCTYANLKEEISADPRIRNMIESKEDRDEGLDQLLDKKLMTYAAKQEGLDKDVDVIKEINNFEKDMFFSTRFSKLIDEKVTISDEEIKDYYEKNKELFKTKKETKLGLIKIETEKVDSKSRVELKQATAKAFWKAQEAYNKIKRGEDFNAVMKEYCGEEWQGILDYQPMGPRGHIIDMSADKLTIGEVSEPVKYKDGYYIIKMLDIKEPEQLPFQEAKDRVESYVRAEKMQEEMEKMLNDFSKKYELVINQENLLVLINSM